MGETSKIAWTDATFNPWMGCCKVSPGCAKCYAESENIRYGRRNLWGPEGVRQRTSAAYWKQPLKWNAAAKKDGVRRRVFCGSWCDVMEAGAYLDEIRHDLYGLIDKTPYLDWLLLTKRPENFGQLLPQEWIEYPCGNLWLGATVEDQQRADERILALLRTPAAVRFLSCEPLLERVNLGLFGTVPKDISPNYRLIANLLHWVIVGGESGANARPCNVAWIRSIVEQCRETGTACFVKQLGENAVDQLGPMRGAMFSGLDKKGALLESLPSDIRVRQFPGGDL